MVQMILLFQTGDGFRFKVLVFRDCTTTESEDVQPKYFHLLAVPRFKSQDPINAWTLVEYSKTFTNVPVVRNKKTSTIQGSFIYMTPTQKQCTMFRGNGTLKFTIHLQTFDPNR